MRHIIYYSQHAWTSGNFDDLMKAGRMDIVCHVVINALFLSKQMRDDVVLHLVLAGPPDPVKHIEISPLEHEKRKLTFDEGKRIDISKKDIAGLIKRMLYKYRAGEKREVFPGCWIEKKPLLKIVDELSKENEIYVLDKKGENLRNVKLNKNGVFILGDHEGLPKAELKRLKTRAKLISLGNKMYFASQAVTILHHELDCQE